MEQTFYKLIDNLNEGLCQYGELLIHNVSISLKESKFFIEEKHEHYIINNMIIKNHVSKIKISYFKEFSRCLGLNLFKLQDSLYEKLKYEQISSDYIKLVKEAIKAGFYMNEDKIIEADKHNLFNGVLNEVLDMNQENKALYQKWLLSNNHDVRKGKNKKIKM